MNSKNNPQLPPLEPLEMLPEDGHKRLPKKAKTKPPTLRALDMQIVKRCAMAGLTERQWALALQVSKETWKRWRNHPDIVEALQCGQKSALQIVESSLFAQATGYDVEEYEYQVAPVVRAVGRNGMNVFLHPDSIKSELKAGRIEIEDFMILKKRTVKHIAAVPISTFFYLTNKDGKNWKSINNANITLGGKVEVAELTGMKVADLVRLKKLLGEKRKALTEGTAGVLAEEQKN